MIGITAIVKVKNKLKIKMRVKRVNSIIRQKIKIIKTRNRIVKNDKINRINKDLTTQNYNNNQINNKNDNNDDNDRK